MFRISAQQGITASEIRGPTTFKKHRSIEFTVFLPFDEIPVGAAFFEPALNFLLDAVCVVLDSIGINTSDLRSARSNILDEAKRSTLCLTDNIPAEPVSGGNGGQCR